MNTQEARRALLADPRQLSPALEQALRGDAELVKFRQQLLSSNDKLAAAFAEVTPVSGLAERIILRARYRRRSLWLGGVAASVMLVGALSVAMLRTEAESPLAVAMLNHVIEEQGEMNDAGNISVAAARDSLAKINVAYNDVGYRIRHIGECVVAGRVGRHLVVSTPQGIVSFVILPKGEGELKKRRTLNSGLYQAVLVPHKKAAFGVFADNHLTTTQLESMMGQMFVPMKELV